MRAGVLDVLLLPHPSAESQSPLAVADASVIALEWLLLAPDADYAQWQLADALLADPWLVVWVDSWRPLIDGSLIDVVDRIGDGVGEFINGWAATKPETWRRPPPGECRRRAQSAVAIAMNYRRADEVAADDWQSYVTKCLRLSGDPVGTDVSAESDVARYLTEQPGCERRVPALARRLAGIPTHRASFADRLRDAKLSAMKELAYGASHEINNPLANIAGRAQALLADETTPDRRHALRAIHRQALRAHEMISDLMLFARPPAIELDDVYVESVLTAVVDELRPEAAGREITLVELQGEPLAIRADSTQLAIALRAAISNAIEAVGHGGNVEIEVAAETNRASVVVCVADTGPGLSERELEHAFDPFFSGREAGRGLGFGLSKCWRIVDAHGGRVTIANRDGGGAVVTMELPVEPHVRETAR